MEKTEKDQLAGFGMDVGLLLCLFIVVITAGARLLGGQAGFEDVSMVSATAAAKMLARLT